MQTNARGNHAKVYYVCKGKGLRGENIRMLQLASKVSSVARSVEIREIHLPPCTVGGESLDDQSVLSEPYITCDILEQ